MPTPWNAGSARLLTHLGFEALATASAGYAFATGRSGSFAGLVGPEILRNAAEIAAVSDLPVSADLEDGLGAAPETCAETIRVAADMSLAGGSIEDANGTPKATIDDPAEAVARVRDAAGATRDRSFLLTARAENHLWGRPDPAGTIWRFQAFSKAGADVPFASGLPDIEAIRTVCAAVDGPVNVVMALAGRRHTVAELSAAGARRFSLTGHLRARRPALYCARRRRHWRTGDRARAYALSKRAASGAK